MSLQTSANFKKELTAFARTKKLVILLSVFMGFATLIPLFYRGIGIMVEAMEELYDEMGMDSDAMLEILGLNATTGVQQAALAISLAGLIVFLLLINSFAGGEQKRRSIIIPRSSGLRSVPYLLPKYIVYPTAAFLLAFSAMLISSVISGVIFIQNDLEADRVIWSGVLLGVNLMFYVCMHLTIGTATGKPGMSAAICVGASLLVPEFFAVLSRGFDGGMIAYNPFSMANLALTLHYKIPGQPDEFITALPPASEMIITILFAIGIMVAAYFVALFAQNARRIDNRGNEMLI
jgi:ABC-2 type transport system permease protein